MFELITGEMRHAPRHPALAIFLSTVIQSLVGASLVVLVPFLYVTNQLPEMPTMMAFVAEPPVPPLPPPPPAPPRPAAQAARATPAASPEAAPIEAPPSVEPEPPAPIATSAGPEGVPGGVEGGVPGGVVGGIVGGIPTEIPPPPPPPPPPPRGPVRIGGQLKPPAILHRVEPEYPAFGVQAKVGGLVILEAVVGEDGHVEEVKVLRSAGVGGVFDRAAVAALKEWQYSPLLLNGVPVRFVLSVTLSFSVG